jgi:hypothetical protein
MTSRVLLSAILATAAVRRKRRADGAVFAIAKIRDTDRGLSRTWTLYVNDPTLIEQIEEMRIGEPIAVAGPFTVAGEREIEFRITAEALVDTKRRKKPKGLIAKESRTESDELDLAPYDGPNDAIPFGGLA